MTYDPLRELIEQQEMVRRLATEPTPSMLGISEQRRQVGGGVDSAAIRAAVGAAALEVAKQLTAAFQPSVDSATIKAATSGLDSDALKHLTAAFQPSDLAQRIVSATSASDQAFAAFARPSALTEIARYFNVNRGDIDAAISGLALSNDLITGRVMSIGSFMAATRFAAASLDFDRFGALASLAEIQRSRLAHLTDRLTAEHKELIASLGHSPGLLASQPLFVSRLPTIGLFAHTTVVRVITPHEPLSEDEEEQTNALRVEVISESEAFLEVTLPELKPAFLSQYRGARQVASKRGDDWWTHGSASLRKLVKGVLHTAAPDEAVSPWAKTNNKGFDNNGHPTRATKIEWLCAPIKNDAYRKYVNSEVRSALAIIELLDAANHVDEFEQFEQQYDWTMIRASVLLQHILTLWKLRREGA